MAHLTNFSFEYFYENFTEDASLVILHHGAKKSKMTINSNQGGPPRFPVSMLSPETQLILQDTRASSVIMVVENSLHNKTLIAIQVHDGRRPGVVCRPSKVVVFFHCCHIKARPPP